MFAVIQTGTQQILVKVDQTIFIEKIPGQPGDKVTFDQVLALPEQVKPDELKNIKVQGVIEKQSKQSKIIVYRHNAKSTTSANSATVNLTRVSKLPRLKVLNRLRSQLMSKVKAGGSSKNNRESHSKRLGAKLSDGQFAHAGAIIYRQRGTKIHPGLNVGRGATTHFLPKLTAWLSLKFVATASEPCYSERNQLIYN